MTYDPKTKKLSGKTWSKPFEKLLQKKVDGDSKISKPENLSKEPKLIQVTYVFDCTYSAKFEFTAAIFCGPYLVDVAAFYDCDEAMERPRDGTIIDV